MLCVNKRYNRASYFFVSIISFFLMDHSLTHRRLESKKKSCLQNRPAADGSCSIFISICATLGNFSENMLMRSFPSVSEIHKAPLSEWSLYFPRLGLSWMFTFSLRRFLVNLKKGSFRRNNLRNHYPHEHRWQEDIWLSRKTFLSSDTIKHLLSVAGWNRKASQASTFC